MTKHVLIAALVLGCGGMAIDELPDGGVDGTHSAGAVEEPELGQLEQPWCIGCLAGVSAPQAIPFGYGLRPINETIGGRSLQFPACQGTQSNMPHACRTPTGKRVFFSDAPASWSSGTRTRFRTAVNMVAAELANAGWDYRLAWNGPDPWDVGNDRYKHTEVIVKPNISNSPHPLFKLTLQGVQNTPKANLKTYLACEIEYDFTGPVGINNNGGHCTGGCAETWDPDTYGDLRQNAFIKALSRCVGLGGDQLPIYTYQVGENDIDNCFAANDWSCSFGGGDGMLRKEHFADAWWSQTFWKNCQANNPMAVCDGIWQQPMGQFQFLSGATLLWGYVH
jgi:hypothetical protein